MGASLSTKQRITVRRETRGVSHFSDNGVLCAQIAHDSRHSLGGSGARNRSQAIMLYLRCAYCRTRFCPRIAKGPTSTDRPYQPMGLDDGWRAQARARVGCVARSSRGVVVIEAQFTSPTNLPKDSTATVRSPLSVKEIVKTSPSALRYEASTPQVGAMAKSPITENLLAFRTQSRFRVSTSRR